MLEHSRSSGGRDPGRPLRAPQLGFLVPVWMAHGQSPEIVVAVEPAVLGWPGGGSRSTEDRKWSGSPRCPLL